MRLLFSRLIINLLASILVTGCVDPIDQTLPGKVNVLVIDGTITNLAEPQVVWLNRSKSDSITGRFGSLPLTGVKVEILVDSSRVISMTETQAGRYQAPVGFIGQINHSYQLRFTLKDGTYYQSTPEVMPAVPPIQRVYERFNETSLSPGLLNNKLYRAANDFYVDWQEPANQHNYYRWDWRLWEKQPWCHTCMSGWYIIYDPDDKNLVEDCFSSPTTSGYFINDYACRTACWAIIHNYDTNVFDDHYNNGGYIKGRRVAQIPFYDPEGCLVEIRQSSLNLKAYQYYKLAQDQTQNNGGVADTPPTILVGNVKNSTNGREGVVGYFTASAVSASRYWLDRSQNNGTPPGLFYAFNNRLVSPEDLEFDPNTGQVKPKAPLISKRYSRPPTAICVEGDNSTSVKPDGWQD